jgi:hypothetical protein
MCHRKLCVVSQFSTGQISTAAEALYIDCVQNLSHYSYVTCTAAS